MGVTITGTGSYIPSKIATNDRFKKSRFFNEDGSPIGQKSEVIIEKFKAITGISERRYLEDDLTTSDMATLAALKAIEDAKIDIEDLDYIILAHNYGDVKHGNVQSDTVPSIATRVKHNLKIKNPSCIGYDLMFGCPGWVEGVIQGNAFVNAGIAQKILVIGAETLSRVIDKHDRDSMIFSDGAGAVVLEYTDSKNGILAHVSATHACDEGHFIYFGESNNKELTDGPRYIKMHGRKIYEFSLNKVPEAMKSCLDKSGIPITDLKKIFIHQANEKMDEAIMKRFYALYDVAPPEGVMPMTINLLGNSSVATVPTLYDLVLHGKMEGHAVEKGDVVMFASVGAGMNINAIVYRV